MPCFARSPWRWTLALVAFATAGAGLGRALLGAGAPTRAARSSVRSWPAVAAVAVAVENDRALVRWPTPEPGTRVVAIVSSLALGPESPRVEARARGVDPARVDRPVLASDGPRRAPRLDARPLPPVPPVPRALPPAERSFHLLARDGDVASASNYAEVRGVLRAVGKRVQVYVDATDGRGVGADVITDLVATFDDRVFPLAARTIGQARDVDGDGRFTVLLSGLLTRLAGGRHAVDGFVRGADLDRALPAPFSNHCDMMYLSTALSAGPHLRTVVAHEYTHAVSYGVKPAVAGEEEGWLDEALAHLVEDQNGFSLSNIDYRVSAFLSQPEHYRLVVDDYYAADLFRSHGNRGATYLFLRWCVDRFGSGLIPALMHSERRGTANLEHVTGRSFADLYRSWTIALFESGFDPAVEPPDGYRSIDLRRNLGGWPLAGPRLTRLTPDGDGLVWNSRPTASRFLMVEPSATGAVELEVTGQAGARLQVTLIPLPADLPRLDLDARLAGDPMGTTQLRVRLREASGVPLRVDQVSWEPLVPPPHLGSSTARQGRFEPTAFGEPTVRRWLTGPGLEAARPLPPELDRAGRSPLVVKAVATDRAGRRVAAWREVEPAPAALASGRAPEPPSDRHGAAVRSTHLVHVPVPKSDPPVAIDGCDEFF